MKLANDFLNLLMWPFLKTLCSLEIVTAFLSNSLCSNFNLTSCAEIDISSKKLHSIKYFQEKSCDLIHDAIYTPQLSRGIVNARFQ